MNRAVSLRIFRILSLIGLTVLAAAPSVVPATQEIIVTFTLQDLTLSNCAASLGPGGAIRLSQPQATASYARVNKIIPLWDDEDVGIRAKIRPGFLFCRDA